jgi:hypothetical protein
MSVVQLQLCLPCDEAAALAQLVGRLGPEDCARLAAPCASYGDRPEADVMWSGLLTLQGALSAPSIVPDRG